MADRTDQFNPYLQQRDAPDFTGASRGADPQRFGKSSLSFFGEALEGVGQLFTAGVGAADEIIKTTIGESAREDVQGVRDEQITFLERETRLADPSLPSEIRQSLEQMQTLTGAREHGRLTDTYYWAQMDVIARKLRNRFPGHKDFVDSTISSLTGGTPANQVRASLQRALSNDEEDGIEGRIRKIEDTKGGLLPPNYPELNKNWQQYFDSREEMFRYTQNYVLRQEAERSAIELNKARLSESSESLKVKQEKGKAIASQEIFSVVNHELNTVDSAIGASFSKLQKNYQELRTQKGPIIPAGLKEQMSREMAETNRAVAARATQIANAFVARGELSVEGRDAVVKSVLDSFEQRTQYITNERWGLFVHNKISKDAIIEEDSLRVLQEPAARRFAGWKSVYGETAANERLLAEPDLLAPHMQFARKYLSMGAFDPNPSSFTADAAAIPVDAQQKVVYQKAADDISKDIKDAAKDNPQAAFDLAQYVFGPDNFKVFKTFVDKEFQVELWNKLANDANAQALFKLREVAPEAWNNYEDWVANGFKTLFAQELDGIKEIQVNRNNVTVRWNFNRSELELVPVNQTDQPVTLPNQSKMGAAFEGTLTEQARLAVIRFNSILNGYKSVLKARGEDVNAGLSHTFKLFKLGLQGQPTLPKTGSAIDNLFAAADRAIAGIPSAIAKGVKGAAKAVPAVGYQEPFADPAGDVTFVD